MTVLVQALSHALATGPPPPLEARREVGNAAGLYSGSAAPAPGALASSPRLGQIGQPKPPPRVPLCAVTLIPGPRW